MLNNVGYNVLDLCSAGYGRHLSDEVNKEIFYYALYSLHTKGFIHARRVVFKFRVFVFYSIFVCWSSQSYFETLMFAPAHACTRVGVYACMCVHACI